MKNLIYFVFFLVVLKPQNSFAFLTECQRHQKLNDGTAVYCPEVWPLGFTPPVYFSGESFRNTSTASLAVAGNGISDGVSAMENELTKALNEWGAQNASFKYSYNGRTSDPISASVPQAGTIGQFGKVIVGGRDMSSGDCGGPYTRGCTAVFGYLQVPFPGVPNIWLQGIHTNCTISININNFSSFSEIQWALKHELGHCTGLDHTQTTTNAVMCTGDSNANTGSPQGCSYPSTIQPDDSSGLQYLYGGGAYSVSDTNPLVNFNSDGLPSVRTLSAPFTTAANVKVTLQGLRQALNSNALFYEDIDSQTITLQAGQRLGLFVDWTDLGLINPFFYTASVSYYVIQEDGTTVNIGAAASHVGSCTINATGQSCTIVSYQMFGARVVGTIVSP